MKLPSDTLTVLKDSAMLAGLIIAAPLIICGLSLLIALATVQEIRSKH